jgi:hypothetical protein
MRFLASIPLLPVLFATALGVAAPTNDYSALDAIFVQRCVECHESEEPEGKLVLESFETLLKGGESGPVIVPGKKGRQEKDHAAGQARETEHQ